MPRDRDKSRYRDRRSLSYSSDSSYERKKSKSKYKRRSKYRDRSESSSHRRRRSSSRGSRAKIKRRSYSRSLSRERDRYESKSKRRSSSRTRLKRERSRSVSSSRSKSSKTKYDKKKSKHNQSVSRSSSSEIDHSFTVHPKKNLDDTETKLEKAIKAAEAVGLTMTKIPTYEYKEVDIKEDMPTIHDRNLLAELNNDSFVPKSFTSSRTKKQSQNIVIDLNSQTVKIPETELKVQNDDSIINFEEIPPEEELKEMWIQKLYHYRKKMLRGEV